MTYRPGSDIWTPYGRIVKGKAASTQLLPVSENKTKGIAWLVSHCHTHSKREMLVKALQKHIPVDIYGNCGKVMNIHASCCKSTFVTRSYSDS